MTGCSCSTGRAGSPRASVNNATPWWENVNPFAGFGICQNNLETGDVVEILTCLPVYQIFMNGMVYHPQVEAAFSWFAFQSPSTAGNGSYKLPRSDDAERALADAAAPGLRPGELSIDPISARDVPPGGAQRANEGDAVAGSLGTQRSSLLS